MLHLAAESLRQVSTVRVCKIQPQFVLDCFATDFPNSGIHTQTNPIQGPTLPSILVPSVFLKFSFIFYMFANGEVIYSNRGGEAIHELMFHTCLTASRRPGLVYLKVYTQKAARSSETLKNSAGKKM